jgi:hypothetical protein
VELQTLDRLKAYQRLNREWRPHLEVAERDFLFYLMDATIGFGRESFVATVAQMVDGRRSERTGEYWLTPVGLSDKTIRRVTTSLKEKGALVTVTHRKKATEYTINLNWTPGMALAVSKKRKELLHRGAQEAEKAAKWPVKLTDQTEEMTGQFDRPYNSSKIQENDSFVALPRQVVHPAVERVLNRHTEETGSPSERRQKRFTKLWQSGHAEGGHGIATLLSKKSLGQLYHAANRLPNDGEAFVLWSVTNWRQIIAEHFDWMTRKAPPMVPNPGFLLAHANLFIEAFFAEKRAGDLNLMSEEDRDYHKLRDSGLSHDASLIELGKKRALADERGMLAKDQERLAREYRVLALERRNMEAERRAAVPRAVPVKPEPVVFNHGTNPYDNGGAAIPDFTDLGDFDGDA